MKRRRRCNGNPPGTACDREGVWVVTHEHGQSFACEEHAAAYPTKENLKDFEMRVRANISDTILRRPEP